MSKRFSSTVLRSLEKAGWQPERRLPEQVVARWETVLRPFGPMHEAARDALLEFGGLRFADKGPGLEKAREPFALDPMLASGEEDRFADFAQLVGSLYPLGHLAHGRFLLGIASDGRVYVLEQDIYLAGNSITEGIEALVLGKELVPVEGGAGRQ